ncbi:MAG: DUF6629 family protein [Chlamydiota bacterium]|nr:DUF6629 family protein [Chlamydiota bacterium]
MCFSAEASMSAAAVIGAIGYLTSKSTKEKRNILLAIVPFLFALQQFSEGIIWLTHKYNVSEPALLEFAKYFYLTFAFVVWPIFFPFAICFAEKIYSRKLVIGFLSLCGCILSLYFFSHVVGNDVNISIVNHSVQYNMTTPFPVDLWLIIGVYSAIIFLPCFITSVKLMWSYGILLMVTWSISEYFYHNTFTSVWCFFSAILSAYMYIVIKANEKSSERERT